MSTSADIGVPYISSQQEQPEITHNEAVLMLSATLKGATQVGLNTPPGSPVDGDVYVVGPAPTGAWAGRANCITVRSLGGWRFIPDRDSSGTIIPMGARQEGLRVWDNVTGNYYFWDGISWSGLVAGIEEAPIDGTQYAREDGAWTEVVGGGGGGITDPVTDVEFKEYNETTATAASGTILRADGGIQQFTMAANTAFTFDLTDGQSLTLHLNGGDTWTATWPTITWVGGAEPTLTANDVIEFWYFNATLFGAYVGGV